jgi:hypothetical protein
MAVCTEQEEYAKLRRSPADELSACPGRQHRTAPGPRLIALHGADVVPLTFGPSAGQTLGHRFF